MAFINLYCSRVVIASISSRILSIVFIEYGLPLVFSNNFLIDLKFFSSKSDGKLRVKSPNEILEPGSILKINSKLLSSINFANDEFILTLK